MSRQTALLKQSSVHIVAGGHPVGLKQPGREADQSLSMSC